MINKIPSFLIAGLWAVFILIASTVGVGMNLPSTMSDIISWDKVAHAFVYFVLAYFLFRGFQKRTSNQKSNIYAFLISAAYGVLMEIIQYSFFPNRYFEFLDILANIVGAIASLGFIYFLITKKSQSYG
ncbi:MAG: VanZ family protein [Bacteroidota bacterium]